jgi:tellurite resistance protein
MRCGPTGKAVPGDTRIGTARLVTVRQEFAPLARRSWLPMTSDTTAGPPIVASTHRPAPTFRAVGRDRWLRMYPIALGLGGLGGSWRTAVGFGAPAWPAVCLGVLCLGVWLTVTAMFVLKGRGDPRAVIADLRHPEQGFALGYIPVIPVLLVAQAASYTSDLRALDLGLVALWAIVTAALVAHWITTPRDRHAIHPGLSLPVVAGPFISCISLQANGWHALAQGLFAVGVFFWAIFGTLIVGRLMTEQRLSDARFPTPVKLMVPPATAGTAWFALN